MRTLEQLHAQYGELLRIPRRPKIGTYKDAEELNALESSEFLEWRRNLAKLTEANGLIITPFERNLEIWRQLWRVIERSLIVVQVVDARNPLLFRSSDLEKYVKEVDPNKTNILLINKADLLTPEQIHLWKSYFDEKGIESIFWSAKGNFTVHSKAEKPTNAKEPSTTESENESNSNESTDEEEDEGSINDISDKKDAIDNSTPDELPAAKQTFISSPSELLSALRKYVENVSTDGSGKCVIGMVGYPNVGKSSTINRLLGTKKTSVSATPGKTKHFQTLLIDDQITLCDCPGLVMPSFGLSNSEMILNGILPIAHMRDYFSPVQLLCNRIPREILQQRYSILLPKQNSTDEPVNAHDLLTAVAFLKGFMSAAGIPDCSRSARLILNDFVQGTLKWCAAPHGTAQKEFDFWTFGKAQVQKDSKKQVPKREIGSNLLEQLERRDLLLEKRFDSGNGKTCRDNIDREFFNSFQNKLGTDMAHLKGGIGRMQLNTTEGGQLKGKKKHFNRNKKEKLRRVFVGTNC